MSLPPVAVVTDGSPSALLDRALDAIQFDRLCVPPAPAAGVTILLDWGAYERDSPVLPDRLLVERLIDRLSSLGWTAIALGSSADSSSTWADNRDVFVLADLFGYVYETAAGTPYEIVDFSEQLDETFFPEGVVLAESPITTAWSGASLRVVVAKAATDLRDGLSLAANVLLAALPHPDKDLAYRLTMNEVDATAAILESVPPHLVVIDMVGIPHGSSGKMAPRAAETRAVVVSTDTLSADAAAAAKMGADPALSSLWKGLSDRRGAGLAFDLVAGDLAPLGGVRLPDPMLVEATRARCRSAVFGRLLEPWLQRIDVELFPFRHALDSRANSIIQKRVEQPDLDPLGRTALLFMNQFCATAALAIDSWRVNYEKAEVMRLRAGVSKATLECRPVEYDQMEEELEALKNWLSRTEHESVLDDLHWRKVDSAVLFSVTHEYPIPWEKFVERVDISRAIQLMNDYVGGSIVVIERDVTGRPRRQVERNIYLPQPNYLAWWAGDLIDVSKIESVRYETHSQRMYWKTMLSENKSATYDDGIVEFRRTDDGSTQVLIFGRQLFTRPPLIAALHLENFPDVEAFLIENAYRSFFSRTFANFEALVEGRDASIGRPALDLARAGSKQTRPIEALAEFGTRLADLAGPLFREFSTAPRSRGANGEKAAATRDDDGFLHFVGQSEQPPADASRSHPGVGALWEELWSGYVEAVRRDLESFGSIRAEENSL